MALIVGVKLLTNYLYGFNGQENDNELKGNGNSLEFKFRIYDPRLGRFLSVDPLTKDYPWYTPYQFAGNQPIWANDLDGLEEFVIHDENNSDNTFLLVRHEASLQSLPIGKEFLRIYTTDKNGNKSWKDYRRDNLESIPTQYRKAFFDNKDGLNPNNERGNSVILKKVRTSPLERPKVAFQFNFSSIDKTQGNPFIRKKSMNEGIDKEDVKQVKLMLGTDFTDSEIYQLTQAAKAAYPNLKDSGIKIEKNEHFNKKDENDNKYVDVEISKTEK